MKQCSPSSQDRLNNSGVEVYPRRKNNTGTSVTQAISITNLHPVRLSPNELSAFPWMSDKCRIYKGRFALKMKIKSYKENG